MDRALNSYQFVLETCGALRLRFTGVRLWHLNSLLNYFILLLLILGISQLDFRQLLTVGIQT